VETFSKALRLYNGTSRRGAPGIDAFRRSLIRSASHCAVRAPIPPAVDDFVITNFNAGTTVTFPLFVCGAARVGAPPQINVIGTAIFVVAVSLMLANVFWQRRRAAREGA
jgi:hypothetical protein